MIRILPAERPEDGEAGTTTVGGPGINQDPNSGNNNDINSRNAANTNLDFSDMTSKLFPISTGSLDRGTPSYKQS